MRLIELSFQAIPVPDLIRDPVFIVMPNSYVIPDLIRDPGFRILPDSMRDPGFRVM